ncbi:hypothetical protein AMATHDRAFT_53827 [Amanita thiersii Skay4041]|uniref:Uncharacterized protein n=1 Tax=Amanita thiersii Skay4041 TaxID=703135 RepID=A0A2A9NU18_9AGAR|nr:hypothetical protein AMATHDRAFT_53827 [Amanita thiersii Skay4041]
MNIRALMSEANPDDDEEYPFHWFSRILDTFKRGPTSMELSIHKTYRRLTSTFLLGFRR